MLLKVNLLLLLSTITISAQIAGVSASKLATYCTDVVPENKIEFEPSIFTNFSSAGWYDGNARTPQLPEYRSLKASAEMYFRFTYGAFKDFEIGFSAPTNVSEVDIGAKYKLPFNFKNKTTFGLLAGLNTLFNNSNCSCEQDSAGKATNTALGYGLIISHSFSKNFSLDFNAIAMSHFPVESNAGFNKFDYSLNADFGYYFVKGIQACLGFNYFHAGFNNSNLNESSLILNPGFTIEKGEMFIIVLDTPITVFTNNIKKSFGFGFALTTLLK